MTNPDFARYFSEYLDDIEQREGKSARVFYQEREVRYLRTAEWLPHIIGGRALEIGNSGFFPIILQRVYGFSEIYETQFGRPAHKKIIKKRIDIGSYQLLLTSVCLNIEAELFPVNDGYFDFILCTEVIEHLDVDPMFMIEEFNRILVLGGHLLITTPNSCSARIVKNVINGIRPHFFMEYTRNRDPYRHNFEYDVQTLRAVIEAGGFEVVKIATYDVFYGPCAEGLELLRSNGKSLENRGDDIFVLAKKVGPVVERWPSALYAA
ncbi:MAG TPA: methyltransferase domain-containing protein [Methylocystis sp.]|nr:methyltransferase domain-containing protein [Methylocystis sp.]